jgi:hypothetical protein
MTTESALLTGTNYLLLITFLGFCFGGLVLEVEASDFLSFGYLSATTFSMGFGLLVITIGSFVRLTR